MGFRYFQCSEAGPYAFFPGDMVVVTGERGEDLGVVVDLLDMASYVARVRAGNHSLDEEEYKLRTIVRLASMAERSLLPNKFHDEQMAGQYCSDAAKHMFRLPMQIVAAEFQFDRSKLFVYYTANSRVDFRELIKHVFSTFKTCIWFKKVNRNNVFEPRPFATVALRTGSF
jgi:cell fate regulator YaaT (PSP1 superfamily)